MRKGWTNTKDLSGVLRWWPKWHYGSDVFWGCLWLLGTFPFCMCVKWHIHRDKYGLVEESVYGLINLLVMLKEVRGRCLCGRIGRSQNAASKKLLGCQIVCYSSASAAKSLCRYFPELQETSEQAQSKFKSEKQSRRQLELKATALEEELTDLRAEKESLERVNSTTEVSLLNSSGQEPLFNKHFNFSFKDYNRMCSL